MHDRTGTASFDARHHIRARIAVRVAGRPFAADESDREAAAPESRGHELRAGRIGFAWRIHGRKADEVGGERHEVLDPRVDRLCKSVDHELQGCSGSARLARATHQVVGVVRGFAVCAVASSFNFSSRQAAKPELLVAKNGPPGF